jgi:hypothetical protein
MAFGVHVVLPSLSGVLSLLQIRLQRTALDTMADTKKLVHRK